MGGTKADTLTKSNFKIYHRKKKGKKYEKKEEEKRKWKTDKRVTEKEIKQIN